MEVSSYVRMLKKQVNSPEEPQGGKNSLSVTGVRIRNADPIPLRLPQNNPKTAIDAWAEAQWG